PPHPHLHSCPTRRSSDLNVTAVETLNRSMPSPPVPQTSIIGPPTSSISKGTARSSSTRTKLAISLALSPLSWSAVRKSAFASASDRKSTRLNSSHLVISY